MGLFSNTFGLLALRIAHYACSEKAEPPNGIIIYADDTGYGDVTCNGPAMINTSNIDRLAAQGLRFTNSHCTSANSTSSHYSLLTGECVRRREGKGPGPEVSIHNSIGLGNDSL